MRNNMATIPIDFCLWAIRERKIGELKTYMILKSMGNGTVGRNDFRVKDITLIGGYGRKTFYNHLNFLKNRNWVGFNDKKYFIRGYRKIALMEGFHRKTAVDFCYNQFGVFRAFIIGAGIGYYIVNQWRRWKSTEVKKHASSHIDQLSAKGYFPIGLFGLSKKFNKCINSVKVYRQIAEEHDFIKIKPRLQELSISVDEIPAYCRDQNISPGQLLTINFTVYRKMSHLGKSMINFKLSGKMKRLCNKE